MRFRLLFLVFFSLSVYSAFSSQDTLLVRIITAPFPIREIVNDHLGSVYVHSLDKVYKFDGYKFSPFQFDIEKNESLLFYEDKLTTVERLEAKGIKKRGNNLNNIPWQHHVNSKVRVQHAISNEGIHWILKEGRFLYGFLVISDFNFTYDGISTRGIFWDENNLYVSSYGGIFFNGNQIHKGKLKFSSTNIVDNGNHLIFGNNKSLVQLDKLTHDFKNLISRDEMLKYGELSAIELFDEGILLGTVNGLFFYRNGEIQELFPKEEIQNIVTIEKQIFVCSNTGVFKINNKNGPIIDPFISIEKPTSILKIPNKYVITSYYGTWSFDPSTNKMDNLLKGTNYESSESVSAFLDDLGNLWIGTFSGLIRLNLATEEVFSFFDFVEFNRRSFAEKDGRLYLGSVQGLLSFNPTEVSTSLSVLIPEAESVDGSFNTLPSILLFSFLIFGAVLLLIRFYFRPRSQVQMDTKKVSFDNVKEYIEENIDSINVDQLRTEMGLSKYFFYNGFDYYFNATPKMLIQEIKKKVARKRLQ